VLTVDDETARLLRARAQGVGDGRRAGSVAEVLASSFAVQAQDLPAAALGLRARATGLTPEAVRHAIDVERSVVRGWFMRGTLFLVAASDARWLTRLLGPVALRQSERRYRELGLDAHTLRRAEKLITAALSADGPLTRVELVRRLEGAGLDVRGQVPIHLIRHSALAGVVCHGPVQNDGEASFVLADDWLPDASTDTDNSTELDGDEAARRLARRYLAAHAPAALADFASWSGLPIPVARRAWQALADAGESTGCDIAGQLCALPAGTSSQVRPAADARLLPSYDNYLLGYRSRRLSVAAEHERQVWPGGGQIRATLVVDGLVRGLWSRRDRGRVVSVDTFGPLAAELTDRIEAEKHDVLRFAADTGSTHTA